MDLRLWWARADAALASRGSAAARAHLAGLDSPGLRAGTIQDGTARGLIARLEEAISLCRPPTAAEAEAERRADPDAAAAGPDLLEPGVGGAELAAPRLAPKDLRRKREFLIASAGARIRFSRKFGLLLVDRAHGVHAEHGIGFEDATDRGCLDRFAPVPGQRPRWFSPAFLTPALYEEGPVRDRLDLRGSFGRGARGFPCRLVLTGYKDEAFVRIHLEIDNRHRDHRMRIRFRGLPGPAYIRSSGAPAPHPIHERGQGLLAATILRACGRLRVGDGWVATPTAQLQGRIAHEFRLGMP